MNLVFDLDDLCDEYDPYEELVALKERFPGLKVTLFAIPGRCSPELLERYRQVPWVELAVHGYHHAAQECLVWGYDEAKEKLAELAEAGWTRVFRAPNWQLNEQVYEALLDGDWVVADHAAYAWPSGKLPMKRYTYNLPGVRGIHGHTWDVSGNGPSDWPEMFAGVPVEAQFQFVSEAARVLPWGYGEIDVAQDKENSWSHESVWGQMALENFRLCFEGKEGTVADFGGNDGFVAAQSGMDVTVIDAMPNRVRYADSKYRVKAICADLTSIPVEDGAFDWGYCSHTLEHVPDIEAAWGEIKRLCKVGCYVVLPVEGEEQFESNPAHYHRATHEEWCEWFGLTEVARYPDALVGVWLR